MTVKTIHVENAHELLRTDPAAILVCGYESDEDFRKNDLEGAISLNEFQQRIDSFPKDEDIIFYCACPNDETATRRAQEYQKQGFTNVQVLQGGVNAWRSAGYGLVGTGA
jgi:rhodanese-related sulfurtransferase